MTDLPPRVLAIDFGTQRLGLAFNDLLGLSAHTLPAVTFHNQQQVLQEIALIAATYGVAEFIVGRPRGLGGQSGTLERQCEKFAEVLRSQFNKPVTLVDETFSSREAEEILTQELDVSRKKRRAKKDSFSAALLLQSYFRDKGYWR